MIGFKVSEDRTAHETPMRSRRFVALFGGRADGRGAEGRAGGREVGRVGSDRVEARHGRSVGRGGTSEVRHASARAAWRETIRANNRQETPPSWRERGTTVVLNLAFVRITK